VPVHLSGALCSDVPTYPMICPIVFGLMLLSIIDLIFLTEFDSRPVPVEPTSIVKASCLVSFPNQYGLVPFQTELMNIPVVEVGPAPMPPSFVGLLVLS